MIEIGDNVTYEDKLDFPQNVSDRNNAVIIGYDWCNGNGLNQFYVIKFDNGKTWYATEEELTLTDV